MKFETVKISDLISEISMGPFGSNIKVECFVDDGIPVLNGSNLDGVALKEDTFRYVTEEKANSLGKANAHKDDVVITHRGTLGQIVFIPQDSLYDRYVISQSQFRVKCNDRILPEYLVYYFHTRIGQHKLLSNASQVGVPALARASTTFQTIEIDLPDLESQQKIVSLLETIRYKISLNQQINKNLEEQAQAIYKEFCTHDENWLNGTVGDVVILQRGYDLPKNKMVKGPYPVAGSTGTIFFHNQYMVESPCIVLGRSGNIGKPRLYLEPCWPHNTSLFSREFKNSNSLWVYFLLHHLDYSAFQGGSAVPTLNRNHIHSYQIKIPPINEQESFARTIEPMIKTLFHHRKESEKLSSMRDALLPRLMSGEIDVSGIEL